MSDLREAGELSTGELLDHRYVLRERIGEGGMARVYRADDEALGRTVAIKVLRDVDAIGSLDRARSETTLLAGLNHHGLVTLFDAHIAENEVSYLVMEYVDGVTLRERIRQGAVPPRQVASIAVDLAEALYVAHSSGIVHRDIKPSNVLLWKSPLPGREWRAKLADFGIAHLLDSARVTTPGMIVGTVAYVAPEQARGEPPAPPADIYALGLLLLEALTGERPFGEAEGIGTVMARLAGPPEIPDSLGPEWRGLLRGMTAMRPEDRPTALEVAIAAERLATGQPPLPASLADLATQETAVVLTGETRAFAPVVVPDASATADRTAEAELPTRRATTGRNRIAAADARRRRGSLITAIVTTFLVLTGGTAAIWGSAAAGAPAPAPTQNQVTEPTVEPAEPSQEPEPSAPAEDTVETVTVDVGTNAPAPKAPQPAPAAPADTSGPGDAGPRKGSGAGSDNSGPGNNNGKGKGAKP
ncbi:serine/threonine-protein kinase [Microbacterium sp. NPDC057407]|uniref:serine/threonine-protein kinase n=1 Tax=Microbacterium sp. NPDC057407 TaxID=3346120 RepID=UPI0036734E30